MQWLTDFTACCTAPRPPGMESLATGPGGLANCSYRKEALSAADYHALTRSLRKELQVPDVATPDVGFLPTLSDVNRDLNFRESCEETFQSILSFAVCGVLESRLSAWEAGVAFDAESRQLLVAAPALSSFAPSSSSSSFVRLPLEPSGVTTKQLRDLIRDRALLGEVFVCNTPSSITFERVAQPPNRPPSEFISAPTPKLRGADQLPTKGARRASFGGSKKLFASSQERYSAFESRALPCEAPGPVTVKLFPLPDASDPSFWKIVTQRIREESRRGFSIRGALRNPWKAKLAPEDLDKERAQHTHLVFAAQPGASFPVSSSLASHEAVEFAPVRAYGVEADGSLLNRGVFETIQLWAQQGWHLQAFLFTQLPLGDPSEVETSEVLSADFVPRNSLHNGEGERDRERDRRGERERERGREGERERETESRPLSSSASRLQFKKCRYQMRYHSLLFFSRPLPPATGSRPASRAGPDSQEPMVPFLSNIPSFS